MGNDEHTSHNAVYLIFWGKKSLFHLIEEDFPLPKEAIIGLNFFQKYDRCAITPRFLIIEKWKVPLHFEGNFIEKIHKK